MAMHGYFNGEHGDKLFSWFPGVDVVYSHKSILPWLYAISEASRARHSLIHELYTCISVCIYIYIHMGVPEIGVPKNNPL